MNRNKICRTKCKKRRVRGWRRCRSWLKTIAEVGVKHAWLFWTDKPTCYPLSCYCYYCNYYIIICNIIGTASLPTPYTRWHCFTYIRLWSQIWKVVVRVADLVPLWTWWCSVCKLKFLTSTHFILDLNLHWVIGTFLLITFRQTQLHGSLIYCACV